MRRKLSERWPIAIAVGCAVVAVVCIATSIDPCRVGVIARYYPSGVCERAPSIRWISLLLWLIAGLAVLVAVGVVAYASSIRDAFTTAGRDTRAAVASAVVMFRADPRTYWIAIGAITSIGLVLRLALLNQPIRNDEATTFRSYVQQSILGALSDYSLPNNHILNTLLAIISTRLLGGDVWALRLPAFIAGVLVIPATYVAGRVLSGRAQGLIAAALVAASSEMILYSTNARGHTMVVLATLCLVVLADWWRRAATPVAVALSAVAAAMGSIANPEMVYSIAGVLTWLVLARHEQRATPRQAVTAVLGFAALTGLLTLAGYSLVIIRSGWRILLSGRNMNSVGSWPELPHAIVAFLADLARDWSAGMPGAVAILLFALMVAGMVPRKRENGTRFGYPLVLVLVSLVLLAALRAVPDTRAWLPALAAAAIAVGEGFERLTTHARSSWADRLAPALAFVLIATLGSTVVGSRSVLASTATGTLPAGDSIARWLAPQLQPTTRVIFFRPTGAVLLWHFEHQHLPTAPVYAQSPGAPRLLVIVNERHRQTLDTVLRAWKVDRSRYGPPQLVRRFDGASVYGLRLRPLSSAGTVQPRAR
jgi:4-amino-4-deoxy-L-arabinose transferase-like glycosyltransferase